MSYDKSSIISMDIIEHVRKRPGMYVPDRSTDGLHHLLFEVIDNSVDEYIAGYNRRLEVTIDGNTATVKDYGRGIPVGWSNDLQMDTLVAVFTKPFTGGKFDTNSYKTSGGTHGVGLKAVTALSDQLTVTVVKDKILYTVTFIRGVVETGDLNGLNTVESPNYTEVRFSPDPTIFEVLVFDNTIVKERLSDLKGLCPNLSIWFNNEEIVSNEGIDFILNNLLIINSTEAVTEEVLSPRFSFYNEKLGVRFGFLRSSKTLIKSFVNTIHTEENGSHVDAVIDTICGCLFQATSRMFTKKQVMDGLGLVISSYIQDPIYRGQHKGKLSDRRVYSYIIDTITAPVQAYFKDNPEIVKYVLDKVVKLEKALEEAELATAIKRIKKDTREMILPKKLSIAYNATPDNRELFIVEGDSAAGSVKSARDPKFQEVLAIKGKIVNALKVDIKSLLSNNEVTDIFLAIGAMEGSNTPMRCKNVFILADSDSDGAHINSLLIGLFTVLFPSFIQKYGLYVVNPPLFTLESDVIRMHGAERKQLIKDFKAKYKNKPYSIYRNKGLGSMSPDEMVPHLDPKTRSITQVIWDAQTLSEMNKILGNIGELRKAMLGDIE